MRVVLAGGGGFLGSHLADLLTEQGHETVIVDNFVTGRPSNIAHLADHPLVTVVEHDVRQPVQLDGDVDLVMNLASPASPSDFLRMPLFIMETGSLGSKNLIELAVAKSAVYFLASTSEVYGDPTVHPQPESYFGNVSTTGPRSCYDEAKRYGEALAMAAHRALGLQVRIVRIFNTYGPRMRPDDGRVVTNFVSQALRGEPITLYGDGEQTRSFCYVADEVRGLLAVALGAQIGPYNVGNPDEYTMRQLAEAVVAVTGSSSQIVTVPMPPERDGDPLQRCPDISRISADLGWRPTTSLVDGLTQMVAQFG